MTLPRVTARETGFQARCGALKRAGQLVLSRRACSRPNSAIPSAPATIAESAMLNAGQ
jgi:hypothetical protein